MTWGAAISALLKAVVEFLLGRAAQKDHDTALKDLGAAEASITTTEIIAEKADAQIKVDAADRGGAADVARRLRDEARAARASGGKAEG